MGSEHVFDGSTYIITNVLKDKTAIDLSLGDRRTVTGFAYNGHSNQKWTLSQTTSESFVIYSYLDRNLSPSTRPFLALDNNDRVVTQIGKDTFNWKIDLIHTKQFLISPLHTNKPGVVDLVLTADGDSPNGSVIQLSPTGSGFGETQLWTFRPT